MLEKPDLQDEKIAACLETEYGLLVAQLDFLPLGADLNTAVYRAVCNQARPYFVKLRRGSFEAMSVRLPKFLYDQGIAQVIAPLVTKTGQLWAGLDAFKLILYPFVDGQNGYEIDLSDRHWIAFGTALKSIHSAELPPALRTGIPQETFTPQWRVIVKTFLERIENNVFDDPIAVNCASFLKARRVETLELVRRAERLAQALQAQPPEFIVCHTDLHAGNILVEGRDAFYIVDWDNPILAPKERDLMFIGGGQFGDRRTPQEEETLFYQGYGQPQIDPIALAYYRYERIVQDIAVECEQIFSMNGGGEDREQALKYMKSNFMPNNVIEIAYKSDKTRMDI